MLIDKLKENDVLTVRMKRTVKHCEDCAILCKDIIYQGIVCLDSFDYPSYLKVDRGAKIGYVDLSDEGSFECVRY